MELLLGAGAVMALLGLLYKAHLAEHRRIDKLIEKSAHIDDVTRHEADIKSLFRQASQDKKEILDAVGRLSTQMNSQYHRITEELGQRPKRDELKK